jgi:SAM-dependent methyltransferase
VSNPLSSTPPTAAGEAAVGTLPPSGGLSPVLKRVLRQPGGSGEVVLSADGTELRSSDGKRLAALRDGVVDFVSPDRDDRGDLKGFGYQWQKVLSEPLPEATVYGRTLADVRQDLLNYLGMTPAQLEGKTGLDVGCGHGLSSRALASMGVDVVGSDLSESAYLCAAQHARVPQKGTQDFVRADVLNFPFAPQAFDVVICLGMAHHTPDPKRAVLNAARCVAPGGRFLLYIYERGAVGYINLREKFPLPHYLPLPLMHLFCRIAAIPLTLALAIRRRYMPRWKGYKNVTLGLFDAYSPRYSYTYDPPEIIGWLAEAGLTDARRIDRCFYLADRPQ